MPMIFVGNLALATAEQALDDLCGQFGPVQSVHVVTGRDTGQSRGFAFIAMPNAKAARDTVRFAHGSCSDRHNPRNIHVVQRLAGSAMATLLSDRPTAEEEQVDAFSAEFRFHIPPLTARLIGTTEWLRGQRPLQDLPLGYFGASTGPLPPWPPPRTF